MTQDADDVAPRSETMMLWDAVAAVKRLHSKREFNGDGYGWANCAECRQHYPCETIKEIEREMRTDG